MVTMDYLEKKYFGTVRVLYVPQLSNIKSGRKYIINVDSNWMSQMNGMFVPLIKRYHWHFIVTVPDPSLVYGWNKDTQVSQYYDYIHPDLKDPKWRQFITFVVMPYETNTWNQRYMFDPTAWKQFFKEYNDIDVVWYCYPEMLRNMKTFMMSISMQGAITLSSFGWIDNPITPKIAPDLSFGLRQMDGAMTCDVPFFESEVIKKLFCKGMSHYFKDEIVSTVWQKAKCWNFGSSWDEIWKEKEVEPFPELPDDKFVMLFPNRTRSYTGYRHFINIVNELSSRRDDIVAVMTVPDFGTKFEDLKKLCPSLVKLDTLKRVDYIRLIRRADFVFFLMEINFPGGIGLREAMTAGAIPIMYHMEAWDEFLDTSYEGFITKNIKQSANKIEALLNNETLLKAVREKTYKVGCQFAYERVYKEIFRDITVLMESKITSNMEKWSTYIFDAIKALDDSKAKEGLSTEAVDDLNKRGFSWKLPLTKKDLAMYMYWRGKCQLMVGPDGRANHWPFTGIKDWYAPIRWASFELGVVDDSRTATSYYYLDKTKSKVLSELEKAQDEQITEQFEEHINEESLFATPEGVEFNEEDMDAFLQSQKGVEVSNDPQDSQFSKKIELDEQYKPLNITNEVDALDVKQYNLEYIEWNGKLVISTTEYFRSNSCYVCGENKPNISSGTGSCFECDYPKFKPEDYGLKLEKPLKTTKTSVKTEVDDADEEHPCETCGEYYEDVQKVIIDGEEHWYCTDDLPEDYDPMDELNGETDDTEFENEEESSQSIWDDDP